MKKFIRFVALIVLLCFSLSGCSFLDELRATRAYGPKGGILALDGTEYKILPVNEYFSPDMGDSTIIYAVQDETIPLLLIDIYGEYGYKSEDGQFLYLYSDTGRQYYCRIEAYDDLLYRMIGDFQPEGYAYYYYDYEVGRNIPYMFNTQQAEALDTVLSTQEPYQLPSNTKLTFQHSITLYQCSSDHLFQKYFCNIYYNDGQYYITMDSLIEKATYIYDVPQGLNSIFEAIMEAKTGTTYL